jgi:HJR/Mrr/RecB family endonuclease
MIRILEAEMARNKNHLGTDMDFVLIILAGITFYTNRAAIDRFTRILFETEIILLSSLLIYIAFRFVFRQYNSKKDNVTAKDIDSLSGIKFEHYVANLLKAKGYTNVRLTEKYDYGVDIIADKDGIKWGIQIKKYSGLVKASAVSQVVMDLKIYN